MIINANQTFSNKIIYFSCPFYGTIPFLIYHKTNKYPLVPVMKSRPNKGFTLVAKEREMLITEPVAAGLWALTNS